jgi:uncharacterized protein YcbX
MVAAGRVVELWRHPVKSMAGERLGSAALAPGWGIPGDRGWAVRDEEAGEIRGAKKIPRLLECAARYLEEPRGAQTPPVEIALSGGARVRSDSPDAAEQLSRVLGRKLTLWPRRPAADRAHYRRAAGVGDERELRAQLGLLPDEPLPDFGALPPEVFEFATPPGTYFDAYELHLLTRASLARLQALLPDARIDARRFRPNLVVDTGGDPGTPELDWCGRELRIGSARLRVLSPVVRCSMTTCAQSELPRDPRIMRALVREFSQNLGVGASVLEPGEIRAGDAVELL